MSTGFEDWDEMDELMTKLSPRRVYAVQVGPSADWFTIELNTGNTDNIRKVINLTSGPIMVGMATVTLKHERDAIALKLAI